MTKRIVTLFTALVLLLSMHSFAFAEEKMVLEFWTGAVMEQEAYEAAIEKYTTEIDPTVEIKLTYLPFKGIDEKVNVALASDTFPDIYMDGAARIGRLMADGIAADLDAYVPENYNIDDINPGAQELSMNGEHLQSVICCINPSALIINRALFEKAGVADLIPDSETRAWTRDDFVAAAKAIAALGDGYYGCGLPAKSYDQDKFIDNYIFNDGDKLTDPAYEKITYNSAKNVENLTWLVETMTSDYAVPGSTGYDLAGMFELFKQGKLGIINHDNGYYENAMKSIEAGEAAKDLDVMIVRYPTTDGSVGRMWMSMYGLMVKAQEDEARVKKAAEFAFWLGGCTDADVNEAMFRTKGQTPSRASMLDFINYDEMKALASMPEATVGNVFGTPGYLEIRKTWNTYLQQALLGIATPEEALSLFEADANALLEKNR